MPLPTGTIAAGASQERGRRLLEFLLGSSDPRYSPTSCLLFARAGEQADTRHRGVELSVNKSALRPARLLHIWVRNRICSDCEQSFRRLPVLSHPARPVLSLPFDKQASKQTPSCIHHIHTSHPASRPAQGYTALLSRSYPLLRAAVRSAIVCCTENATTTPPISRDSRPGATT